MKEIPTIHDLRKQNYKVRVIHRRVYPIFDQNRFKIVNRLLTNREVKDLGLDGVLIGDVLTHGGHTRVEVLTPNGAEVVGEAECSKKDQFNRKRSLNIAIARALQEGGKSTFPF
jgi:hypothetical protein